MNTAVSFELAKLLKEKGFNEPTFYYYENEKLIEPYLENGSSTDTEFRVDLSDLKEHFNKWSKKVSAPTVAEVVMWLYEKHEIWLEIRFADDYKIFFYDIINTKNLKAITSKSVSHFNSPTEAYENAIKYCLEKII